MIDLKQFNFKNSTELAKQQDSYLMKYKNYNKIDECELSDLKKNLWVISAEMLAPGNLVIRQFCLIDLFNNSPDHTRRIKRQINCLSYGKPNNRIWAEGYSYWLYTRSILDVWINRFPNTDISDMIHEIDDGFIKTSYCRDGSWYPAPLGDVRDQPLGIELQLTCEQDFKYRSFPIKVANVTVNEDLTYFLEGWPIGMNLHTIKSNDTIQIIDGIPVNFTWYTGYNNKYPTKDLETADLLDIRRLETIGKLFKTKQ